MKKNLNDLVMEVLKRFPETRGDDFKLVIQVEELWYRQNSGNNDHLIIFDLYQGKKMNLLSFESITRARRKIQAEHIELCDPETIKKRLVEEEQFREFYGSLMEDIDEMDL